MDYPDDIIFSLEITNGYVFRQIFELYDKLVVDSIPIFLKESGITIRTCAISTRDNRKFISDIEIFTDDIIEYYINTDLTTIKKEDSKTPCQIEKISMSTVKTVLKSITKAKSVRLYKKTTDDDICIQIKGVNIENSKISSGKHKSSDYDISRFDDLPTEPNIKIDIGQFCDTMKGVTRDTDFTIFKLFEKGLIIEARNTIGSVVKDNRWGKHDGEDYNECVVGTNFIKALCKINSMANYSIVKLYSNKTGCFKLNHKIGDFGEHNIFISEN
jgi:hypothetical protein